MVGTEVVTGTRSPPTSPAGVVHPGVEPGHSRSLRVDPVHPGGAGSPGGYLPGRVAREASSSHQRGRPVLPVQPTRRIRRKPRGQTVRKHTHFCRSETSQFKTRMSPTSRQSHHDRTQGAWRVAQVSTAPQVPHTLLSEPQRYPWNPRCTPSLGIHGRSQRESSLAPEGGLLGKASTASEHAENCPSADWVSSPPYTKVAGASKSIFFCASCSS